MRKMQFGPKNGMPRYHGTQALEKGKLFLWDASVRDGILVIDFYKKVQGRWSAVFRILINDREFENYDYTALTWNRKRIESLLVEKTDIDSRNMTVRQGVISGTKKKLIESYIRQNGGNAYKSILDTVGEWERMLAEEQRENAMQRKRQRIQEEMALLPPPPENFRKVILETAFRNEHILYFGKEGAYCTRCGRGVTVREKTHNETGRCPECGKPVVFKNTRYIREHAEDREVLYIQKHEKKTILRYFKCTLFSAEQKRETLEMTESVRTYHKEGLKFYAKRYIHYFGFQGEDFWTDRMSASCPVVYGKNTCLYVGNMEEVREITAERTAYTLEQLGKEGMPAPVRDILCGYMHERSIPLFERLYKAGMRRLALEVIKGRKSIDLDRGQRELKKILKISKPMMEYMAAHDGNSQMLEIMQDAFAAPHGLSNEKIFELAAAGIGVGDLAAVAEREKIMKLFHYLKRTKGYKNPRTAFEHYRDYMGMVTEMGYDMSNGTVRYPCDLRMAHGRAVTALNEVEADKRKREALMKYPNIRKRAGELSERYSFRTKEYVIMVPESAADIVEEGRTLHHCVGRDGYLKKHDEGKNFILFMRKADKPGEPYYTIEIEPADGRIVQYYGINDTKPDREKVDGFLRQWKRHLSGRVQTENEQEENVKTPIKAAV